jgi:hypothetical protein
MHSTSRSRDKEPYNRKALKSLFLMAIVITFVGCLNAAIEKNEFEIDDMNKTLDVTPVIDNAPLGGFTEERGEELYVISGDIGVVKEELNSLVIEGSAQRTSFSQGESLNIVVFRGVFRTGGHGIVIDEVQLHDGSYSIHATYTDAAPGMAVIQAFTQPTAIIPLGMLSEGSYEARLFVTMVQESERGREILDEDVERARIAFEVE